MSKTRFYGNHLVAGGLCLLIGLGRGNVVAAVNDIAPADYFPLAPGMSTLTVYAYHRHSTGPYMEGDRVQNGEVDNQILALRATHFIEWMEKPLSLLAVLPWAKADAGSSELRSQLGQDVSGMADVRLGATSWLINNVEQGRYLGLTGIVILPTGDYDRRQLLNIGENRYRATLSLGWIETLTPELALELSPEVAWYGDNHEYYGDYRLEQEASYALTGYLRYRTGANWFWFVGGQLNEGGSTRIDGIDQDNAPGNTRAMLGGIYLSDDRHHQWTVRLARDLDIDNGFRTDGELLVRYLWMF